MASMGLFFAVFIILVTLTEYTNSQSVSSPLEDGEELPLSRSLGFYVRRMFRDTREDTKLSQEYMDLYQEMMKASQETMEKFDDEEQERLKKIVGREKLEIMKKGLRDRRRISVRIQSPFGRRRIRSQAIRREKLNGQSLRSHQKHIRKAGRGNRWRTSHRDYDTSEVE